MNAQDVIRQVQEDVSEYLEMVNDPAALVAGILANKVIELKGYIEYLEKRLQHVNTNSL